MFLTILFLQEEVVKAKRLQSISELPNLLSTSSNLHGRPSIGGLGSSDTVDVDDDTPCPTVQPVDTSINKSPVNASNSEFLFLITFILKNILFFFTHFVFWKLSFFTVSDEIVAESLEKLMENKLVREKKMELEKKLESLRKKHEKEKMRLQSQKASLDGEKHRSKFYMSSRLVKRLSNKNM